MPNQWRVVDLTEFEGQLSTKRGVILVEAPDSEPVEVSVADIAVVMVGVKVAFDAAVVHRLSSAGVPVLFCDWRGVPEGAAYSWSSNGRVGARQRAQTGLTVPRRKNAWGRIVSAKIKGQAQVLQDLGADGCGELTALAAQVRSGDPGNLEAQAARLYWTRLMDKGQHRDPGSRAGPGWNGCLDYGYAILRGHGVRAVLAAGMLPALGIFHRGRSNGFALVDDLMEPFRPAVDDVVFRLSSDADPSDREVKRALVSAAGRAFGSDGLTVPSAFLALAQQFGQYCEGEVERLAVPHWRGPSDDMSMDAASG
ncbi:type II CRISPR-associated endonuclease Cas1 [Schaalia sp. 19OD2882]|uniref:type II CRISPR-associated endonuclease Cas1 n=1 Tax=Schaalia sp. 19OD2882 TaxID=2794089 RepID=UPI001C1EA07E|nr:type II CRISPR-associated endonuclease Cas1 [Schaalia sp. 19OD2882]QWW19336.1 type II CRISPR-associated endonuclease Cas1 [Schaalia sp. 19OD2882]